MHRAVKWWGIRLPGDVVASQPLIQLATSNKKKRVNCLDRPSECRNRNRRPPHPSRRPSGPEINSWGPCVGKWLADPAQACQLSIPAKSAGPDPRRGDDRDNGSTLRHLLERCPLPLVRGRSVDSGQGPISSENVDNSRMHRMQAVEGVGAVMCRKIVPIQRSIPGQALCHSKGS